MTDPLHKRLAALERWMVDYEHGDDEPQHAVLSWSSDDPTKALPVVGEILVRLSDVLAAIDTPDWSEMGEALNQLHHVRDFQERPPLPPPTPRRPLAVENDAALDQPEIGEDCSRCGGRRQICSGCGGPWSKRDSICYGERADPMPCPDCTAPSPHVEMKDGKGRAV